MVSGLMKQASNPTASKHKRKRKAIFFVYMLRCNDHSLYTGYTTNLNDRLKKHNNGEGAKCLRGKRPVKLVWSRAFPSLRCALKTEYKIKQLNKTEKELFIVSKFQSQLYKISTR